MADLLQERSTAVRKEEVKTSRAGGEKSGHSTFAPGKSEERRNRELLRLKHALKPAVCVSRVRP